MPELPPTILNFSRSSKSSTFPSRQIRKVLCFNSFASVVCPVIAPSSTLQYLGLPSQPERSLPLKIDLNSPSSAAMSLGIKRARASAGRSLNIRFITLEFGEYRQPDRRRNE